MEMIIIKTPTTFSILATNALASTLLLYPKEATFGKKAWLMGCVIVIMQIRTIRSAAEYRPTIAGVAKKAKITVEITNQLELSYFGGRKVIKLLPL